MSEDVTTTKMSKAALQAARLIAAATGEPQFIAVERVLLAEVERLGLTGTAPTPKRKPPPEPPKQILETRFQVSLQRLRAFAKNHSIDEMPRDYVTPDGFRLGSWCAYQRANRHALPPHRVKALEAVPGWVWKPGETPTTPAKAKVKRHGNAERAQEAFELGMKALRQYIDRTGIADVPANHIEDDYPLGRWVMSQRINHLSLPPERVQALEAMPGWVWRKKRVPSIRGWQPIKP